MVIAAGTGSIGTIVVMPVGLAGRLVVVILLVRGVRHVFTRRRAAISQHRVAEVAGQSLTAAEQEAQRGQAGDQPSLLEYQDHCLGNRAIRFAGPGHTA